MVGSAGITSALGFIYWWLAARQYSPAAVGFASAAISAMTLLGTFGMLGLGTLLVGELPRQPDRQASLISTSLILVGSVGMGLGLLFAVLVPHVLDGWQELGSDPSRILLFALGVGLTALTLVLDQAMIGLLQGGLQLWRNALFAGAKLAALYMVARWISQATGLDIYLTWTIGNVFSLLVLLIIALVKGLKLNRKLLPRFRFLRKLGGEAFKHHALNLTLQAPSMLLPIIVTAVLSVKENGWFYIAWNLSSIGNIVTSSFTMVLYAVSAAQPHILARKLRLTLGISFAACVLINLVCFLWTQQILDLFGHSYAGAASWSLRILSIESFLFIIKGHYIAVRRIHGRVAPTALATIATGTLEVGGATVGAFMGGLTGLSLGWLAAMCIETVIMFPTVYKAARVTQESAEEVREESAWSLDNLLAPAQPSWKTDTLIQPVWLGDTLTLNAIVLPRKAPETDQSPEFEDNTDVPTIRLANFFWYSEQETLKLPSIK